MPAFEATTIQTIAKAEPELALFAAVLHRAFADAQSGNGEAQDWLGSDACFWYCEYFEIDGIEAGEVQALLIETLQSGG